MFSINRINKAKGAHFPLSLPHPSPVGVEFLVCHSTLLVLQILIFGLSFCRDLGCDNDIII